MAACIQWQQEERANASVGQLVEVARAERELGNDFFHQNMFGKAMRKYEKVLEASICHFVYQNVHSSLCVFYPFIVFYFVFVIGCVPDRKCPSTK